MDWAEQLHEEVCEYWKKHFKDSQHNLGFQVFYSPVDSSPILILGENPGGNDPDVFDKTRRRCEQRDFSPPLDHDYLKNPPPIGKKTTRVLEGDAVENSVKTNIQFFRSAKVNNLENALEHFDDITLSDVREQCDKWWKSFYYNIEPDIIVCEGVNNVFNRVTSKIEMQFEERDPIKDSGDTNYRIFRIAESDELTVIGYTHPTGAGQTSTVFDRNESTIRKNCQSVLETKIVL